MEESLLQLGGVVALFALMIRELFAYLKSRKESSGNGASSGMSTAILAELQKMNDNHLHSLEKAINDGNSRLVEAINNGNLKQIELLGDIKGKLDR